MWQCSISNSGFVAPKWYRKIYNVLLRARGRHGLGDDDGVAGSGMVRADSVTGSGTSWGRWHRGLREDDGVASLETACGQLIRKLKNGAGSIVSRAWGGQQCSRLRNGTGSMMSWALEMAPMLSGKTVRRTGGSIGVENDGAEASKTTRW
jgi:hypothetical protein